MPADPPGDQDFQQLVAQTAQRLVRLLPRRGLLGDDRVDPLAQDEPLLTALTRVDYPRAFTCGMLYPLAAYWRFRSPQESAQRAMQRPAVGRRRSPHRRQRGWATGAGGP
ncbi:MAG: hypothetical protein AB1505_23370 [Candidatus Latescibacterota bacterium]